ncbi:MAG: ABC transporter ATP-binding protein [Candidatus Eisenbacteria bacterium]
MLLADLHFERQGFSLEAALESPPGEVLVLIGESGCGKTTLLRLLAGLDSPDRGRVTLNGETWCDTAGGVECPAHLRSCALVPQDLALFPHLSVHQNVAFGLEARRVPPQARRQRVRDALEAVGLAPYASRRPRQLSGGQQQRVALARALVTEPALLLLDEPLSALDVRARVELRAHLVQLLAGRAGVTVHVTHDPGEALALGDRIAVLEAGRIVQVGTREELLRKPRTRFIADFLGVNLLRGRVSAPGTDGLAQFETVGATFTVRAPGFEGAACALIHPGHVTLGREAATGSARNQVTGVVAEIMPEPPDGAMLRVRIAADTPLVATLTRESATVLGLAAGTPVRASFKATEITLFA